MFFIDQLTPVWNDVEAAINADRLQYADLYVVVEDYLGKNRAELALGGTTGINLLLEHERTINDFTYEIYAERGFFHANEITNLLAHTLTGHKDDYPIKVIYLKTAIPHQRYQIIIDSRPIFTIIDMGRGRGHESVSPMEVISPVTAKSFDKARSFGILSPETLLIDLYRTLYSPNKSDVWEVSLKYENRLFHHILPALTEVRRRKAEYEKIADKEGGAITSSDTRRDVYKGLIKHLIRNNYDVVLIGEHALVYNRTIPITESMVIQIIINQPIEQIFESVQKIVHTIAGPHTPVTRVTRGLHIMQDWRILRTAIRIGDEKEQKEIMYIYNSAQYDLIPCISIFKEYPGSGDEPHFYQIGNPFVILRFLLIDLWMLRWVMAAGGINEAYGKYRLDSIMESILTLRNRLSFTSDRISTIGAIAKGSLQVFQPKTTNYFGQYEDEVISQKEKMKQTADKFPDYYPQRNFRKNGAYRILDETKK